MKLQQKLASAGAFVMSTATAFTAGVTGVSAQTVKSVAGTTTGNQPSIALDTAFSDGFASSPTNYVNTIVSVVFVVGALLALAYLVMGAIQWITAAGDKSKTESARNHITAALIGMLILAGAFAIFQIIMGVLGVDGSDPFSNIQQIQ